MSLIQWRRASRIISNKLSSKYTVHIFSLWIDPVLPPGSFLVGSGRKRISVSKICLILLKFIIRIMSRLGRRFWSGKPFMQRKCIWALKTWLFQNLPDFIPAFLKTSWLHSTFLDLKCYTQMLWGPWHYSMALPKCGLFLGVTLEVILCEDETIWCETRVEKCVLG